MKGNSLIEILPVLIVVIAVLAALIGIIVYIIRKQKAKIIQLKEQGLLGKGAKGQGNYEGVDYSYLHFRGGKNAPPFFKVSVKCPSNGDFKITRETRFDRFFKKLGICVELETRDKEFDDNFFITTDTVGFTREYLSKPEKRGAITEIFSKGFKEIKHDGKAAELTASWNSFPRDRNMEIKTVEEIALLLGQLSREIPNIYEQETAENAGWKQKRSIVFAVPIFLLIAGIAGMVIGFSSYRPLDEGKIILNSFKYSLPGLLLFLWAAVQLLKGRSSSHRELITAIFLSLVGFSLAGMGGEITLNGWLDKGKPAVHQARVIAKYRSKNKNSYTYYAIVESWREGQFQEKIKVGRSVYDYLEPVQARMIITTKPGKFGFEWLMDFR
ncbi:MAG TPA: hypothetical protein VK469_03990 [Candidatus Kapabacteria bacterium]|nr:hypothetical protein [Candidatus Kapabacteria bacterium]